MNEKSSKFHTIAAQKKKKLLAKISKIDKMTPTERTLFLIDKQILDMLPKRVRVFYGQTLAVKRVQRKPPSIPIWVGRLILVLTLLYCVWCVYYILSFAALRGGRISTAWLISSIFANTQDILVIQPLKCLIRFVILPELFIRWLIRRDYFSIGRVRAKKNWAKIRVFFAFGLLKRDLLKRIELQNCTQKQLNSVLRIQCWWRSYLGKKSSNLVILNQSTSMEHCKYTKDKNT